METNKIYNQDCVKGIKNIIPNNSIDFVLTDPPFNVGIDYHGTDDNLDDEKYSNWCLLWINQLYRVLKDGKYCIIFTGDKKLYYVQKAINKSDFQFHHYLKWHKPTGQRGLSGTVLFYRTELAFVLSKGKPNIKNINRKDLYSDTLIYNNVRPNDKYGSCEHNCRRPVPLYRQIIKGFTKKDDVVLDCFLGSGTTAISCKQISRKYIGFEINEKYIKIINKGLRQNVLTSVEGIRAFL